MPWTPWTQLRPRDDRFGSRSSVEVVAQVVNALTDGLGAQDPTFNANSSELSDCERLTPILKHELNSFQ